MQYKGDDLDLRVPHGRTSRDIYTSDYEATGTNGRWPRSAHFTSAPAEPLWVDEVLLACCNYAFDVALANGAAEVSLEHLANAMTRVEAAARILESRGVREGQLRRESAALIASEIPAANAGEAAAPRRSAELEDVLRRACDVAHRRGSPASIEDVLRVLLHFPRDLPVVLLLRRLTTDWQRSEWARLREPEAVSRPVPVQLVANDGVPARMAGLEDSLRLMQSEFAADRKLLMDLLRDVQRDLVAQRGDAAAFRSDLGHRLEAVERSMQVRGDARVQAQLAERLMSIEKIVHGGISEALREARDLAQRFGTLEAGLDQVRSLPGPHTSIERMAALEKAVHAGLGEGARNWAHLGQKLAQLETVLAERRDTTALDAMGERMAALERAVQASLAEGARNFGHIGTRLATFEAAIGEGGGPIPEPRLAAIEAQLEASSTQAQRRHGETAQRMEELARTIEAGRAEAAKVRTDVTDRLSSIETYLADGPSSQDSSVRELADRLGGLERAVRSGFGDAATTTGRIAERLTAVERGLAEQPRDGGDAMLILDERLSTLGGTLEAQSQQTLKATAEIAERLQRLEQSPGAAAAVDGAALFAPVEQRLASLEAASAAKVDAMQSSLAAIGSRLDQLDERLRGEAVVTEAALRGRDQDFDFIYSEIKQLGQSQTTLNSAVNDWRNESQEHFGTLAGRLDKLALPLALEAPIKPPRKTTTPFDLPQSIKPTGANDVGLNGGNASTGAPSAEAVKADDYALPEQPGRGFWYWLFGTASLARANRKGDLKVDRMR